MTDLFYYFSSKLSLSLSQVKNQMIKSCTKGTIDISGGQNWKIEQLHFLISGIYILKKKI